MKNYLLLVVLFSFVVANAQQLSEPGLAQPAIIPPQIVQEKSPVAPPAIQPPIVTYYQPQVITYQPLVVYQQPQPVTRYYRSNENPVLSRYIWPIANQPR